MDANKSIRYSHYQISDKVQFGGLMDQEQCKALARKVMQMYDTDGDGQVDSFEIGFMLSDCYRAMNKGFNPTPTDIASFTRVLDKKGTGRVQQQDIEALCMKYFAGNIGYGGGAGGIQERSSIYSNVSVPVRSEGLGRIAQERLDIARKIFHKIDQDNIGFITEKEVPNLLRETYKQMGMNYEPTQEDVLIWIKMTDSDGDGRVTLEDYENLVLKSLKQQGIQIN